jgi:hypothetical protein
VDEGLGDQEKPLRSSQALAASSSLPLSGSAGSLKRPRPAAEEEEEEEEGGARVRMYASPLNPSVLSAIRNFSR